jgi:hypothetical protein
VQLSNINVQENPSSGNPVLAGGRAGWRAGGLAGWRAGGRAGGQAGGQRDVKKSIVAFLNLVKVSTNQSRCWSPGQDFKSQTSRFERSSASHMKL